MLPIRTGAYVVGLSDEYVQIKILLIMYRFGKERKTENSILFDAEYIDGEDKPIAVFTFRYRSKSQSMNAIRDRSFELT